VTARPTNVPTKAERITGTIRKLLTLYIRTRVPNKPQRVLIVAVLIGVPIANRVSGSGLTRPKMIVFTELVVGVLACVLGYYVYRGIMAGGSRGGN
jgi:hypothetical protein